MILSCLDGEDRIVCLSHNCDLSASLCGKQTLEEKEDIGQVGPHGTSLHRVSILMGPPPGPLHKSSAHHPCQGDC